MNTRKVKRIFKSAIFAAISVLVLSAGCSDPLTKILKDNGYATIRPVSDKHCVGDIYKKTPKGLMPVAFVDNVLTTSEEQDKLRKSVRAERVGIPVYDANRGYTLTVNADVIGKVTGDLEANGVRKFKVKIEDPCQYVMDTITFRDILYPKLLRKKIDINGKYVVMALLEANRLEYKLMDGSGAKITVKPGGEIERVVKAELGATWTATSSSNLSISRPSYIGYKMYEITEVVEPEETTKTVEPKETTKVVEPEELEKTTKVVKTTEPQGGFSSLLAYLPFKLNKMPSPKPVPVVLKEVPEAELRGMKMLSDSAETCTQH
jgi:hypothetical protein